MNKYGNKKAKKEISCEEGVWIFGFGHFLGGLFGFCTGVCVCYELGFFLISAFDFFFWPKKSGFSHLVLHSLVCIVQVPPMSQIE